MISIAIGISSALLIILLLVILRAFDKRAVYGLILAGIGFLYVGFVWTDLKALVVCSIQAILFLFLAYYGMKKRLYVLAIGYFLHGCWDLAYNFFEGPALIPSHYDIFCLTLDFTIGIYILIFVKQFSANDSNKQQDKHAILD
jgi:hypothetical protein